METWFLFFLSLAISALLKAIINLFVFLFNKPTTTTTTHNLPPGPLAFPVIGNFLWLRKSFSELEPIIRSLHAKLGPLITLHISSQAAIFVADRALAYQALIQNGAIFADRPLALHTNKILTSNQHNISSASYGPTWRLLRRNLTEEILHPSRVKSYAQVRKWVLEILQNRFALALKSGDPVRVVDHLQFAMFCLLALMCFGDKLDQTQIEEIEDVERRMLLNWDRFNKLNYWPSLSKILFRERWAELLQLRKEQEDVLIPLIRARKKAKEKRLKNAKEHNKEGYILCYVDTLLDLELPNEKRKLDEQEMVTLCNEFLNAGTDTTSTALQWIMANLVKYPQIQEKLFMEIKTVIGDKKEDVKEEDMQKMPYLKAIILEGLRRHPPSHFVLPHAATKDFVLDKYVIPKNGIINFMVADMGWDPKVWEDPMEFKPERFLNSNGGKEEAFDITAGREIKMMPFGAGRRICPAYGLAVLHLQYFLANLVWKYEWKAAEGDNVDLTEKQEFTVVMKNPLQSHIYPRLKIKAQVV